jgi:hypothetical protein
MSGANGGPGFSSDETDLGRLLNRIDQFIRLYVVLRSSAQAHAIVLWVAFTWIFEQFDTVPYLSITSPEKRSGKSRLLDLLELLVARPWRAVLPSEAVVFRKIEKDAPTLLLDEIDAIYGPKAREHEGLRALLNAGHRRGSKVPRCVGPRHDVVDFDVFGPKALAGIGELPDTVADRSIPVRLSRRKRTEVVKRFRFKEAEDGAIPLREGLEAWAASVDLLGARPEVPEALNDRAADGWEPLVAIADAAGGDWPERAREAALTLHGAEDEGAATIGVRLLADLKLAFTEPGSPDALFTAAIVAALRPLEDAPWGDLDGKGKLLDARGLANLLRPYGVRPRPVRVGAATGKGYKRKDFEDAWSRYVPAPAVTSSQLKEINDLRGNGSVTPGFVVTDSDAPKSSKSLACDAVTAGTGVERGEDDVEPHPPSARAEDDSLGGMF